ncbi:alcohol dehydrogenase catalytic domain-containing protein [Nakamurella sp. YIM 132087]|uniref:alcohol dehydrogenase n=1 Tax=Nakamurella alba TaxID=2665158 RepID=A0A7K1FPI2_9ACTN|nr:NAD(P)-dependent alcohol dehydrogenase [Nakamurella alba]MTD16058.1 alcohol dehydrogenase catalytic domain-containing protein [Nakamurella alba]
MKAVQYRQYGAGPEVVEIADPTPGPGQILLRITAAGLCHSDDFIMSLPAEKAARYALPMTLGHEGAGVVAALGDGLDEQAGIAVGDACLVYGAWGCGVCRNCSLGRENYCTRAAALGLRSPGLGAPGALAEYMLIDSPRHLVPIGDLDPVATVPLTDAGLTPYHAINRSLSTLVPGSTTVVIGAGGLGHVAIRLLRAMTSTRVIALDVSDEKLELAREVGAHETVRSDPAAITAIRDLTGGNGAEVVLDFVGAQPTVDIATRVVAIAGDVHVIGVGGGAASVGQVRTPLGVSVSATYWGTRNELAELVELARLGALTVETETFGIDDTPEAYRRLHDGTIRGRAVIVPG